MITECLMNFDDLYEKDWSKDSERTTSTWHGRQINLPRGKATQNLFSLVKCEDKKEDRKKESKPSATFRLEGNRDFENGKKTDKLSGKAYVNSDDGRIRGVLDGYYKRNEDGKHSKGVTFGIEMDVFAPKK